MKKTFQLITGIILIILALFFFKHSIVTGILLVIAGTLIIPRVRQKLYELMPNLKRNHIVIFLMFVFIALPLSPLIQENKSSQPARPSSVSKAPIDIISLEEELDEWGEGRWDDWAAGRDNEGGITVRIYANSYSNEVAINSYCNVVKESLQETNPSHLSDANVFIYQDGDIAKVCLY